MSQFVVLIAFGFACALLAQGRGRHPVAWFFLGWLFNVFALVLLLVLPDRGVEEGRRVRMETDLRRQRERQAKDRQVADRRHDEMKRRLEAHDRALGLDTSGDPSRVLSNAAPPPLPPGMEARAIELERLPWYYAREGAPVGPIAFDELRRLVRESWIDGATLVWSEAIVDWRPASAVPELAELQHA